MELDALKERELEILRLIANGWSNSEIADKLVVSMNTVRWYNKQIYSKLGIHSRTLAIARAREMGLLENDAPIIQRSIRASNLPVQPTPFLGREAELTTLHQLLTNSRLITLIGAGGMGKTRLAIQAAQQEIDVFEDGVFFVSLTSLRAMVDMIPRIAADLNVQFRNSENARQEFLDYLRESHLLLVLDNFEHLLDGATLVSEMLHAAPHIKILVTSRERLNLREETLFQVTGMALPQTVEDIPNCGTVQLFIQSARRVQPNYQPTEQDFKTIHAICNMVEGMPLGIELAAAWMDMLLPQEIAQEISQTFDFLETQLRDMPERHRSMRVVFDSAWQRLSDKERDTFMKLALFQGGFTREAAENIAGTTLKTLQTLANKSLLRRCETRYEIHELLRQYAEEQLEKSGQKQQTQDAHSAFYADFLRQRESQTHQIETLNEIEADFENVRAGWHYAVEQQNLARIEQSREMIYQFCTRRSRYQEASRMFDYALQINTPDDPVIIRLRKCRGKLLSILGRLDEAISDLQFVRQKLHELGDTQGELDVLIRLGQAYRKWDYQSQALIYLNDGLDLARESGNEHAVADILFHLGTVAWDLGENHQSENYHREAVEIAHRLNLTDSVAIQATHGLSESIWVAGQPHLAMELGYKSLQLARQIGDKGYEAENLQNLAWFNTGELGMGNYLLARQLLTEAMTICEMNHLDWHSISNLFGLGYVYAATGDYEDGLLFTEQGYELARSIGAKRFMSVCLDFKGRMLQDLNLLQRAEASHLQAFQTASNCNSGFFLPRIRANLAIVRLRQGDMRVEQELLDALNVAQRNKSLFHAVRCLEGLAEFAVTRGHYETAFDRANQLLEIAEAGHMQEMKAQAHRWRGEAWLAQANFTQAHTELCHALEMAQNIGRVRLIWDCHAAIEKLYEAQGQPHLAAYHQAQIQDIVAQIANNLKSEDLRVGLR